MGAGSSIPEGEKQELLEATKFKKKELKAWYIDFIKDYPTGRLDKEQFNDLYSKIYISDEPTQEKTDHLFKSFDHNNDGYISFKELMSTLSLTTRGTVREKMEWVFDIYDVNGDGLISMNELNAVTKNIHYHAKNPDCRKKITLTRMNSVFMDADTNNDGYLTVEEFVAGVEGNPELYKLLDCGQEKPVVILEE